MFQNSSNVIDLDRSVVHPRAGGVAESAPRPGVTDLGEWTVASIHATDDHALHSDVWECHPSGHEVLCVVSGALAVHVRDDAGASRQVARLGAGQAYVVPPGTWHRLAVEEPAVLVGITPRSGTRHERSGQR